MNLIQHFLHPLHADRRNVAATMNDTVNGAYRHPCPFCYVLNTYLGRNLHILLPYQYFWILKYLTYREDGFVKKLCKVNAF